MKVWFITIRSVEPRSSADNCVESLLEVLGPDIPRPCALEGEGIQYLCCVDANQCADALEERLERAGWSLGLLGAMDLRRPRSIHEVNDDMYNSRYEATFDYRTMKYELELV